MMRSLFFGLCLCLATSAFADPVKAREHFSRAETSYASGEYQVAIYEYASAYREEQDAAYLFNLAQCYRLLGDSAAAISLFQRYLREAPDAENRELVEGSIVYLQSTPATVVLTLPDLAPIEPEIAPKPPERGKKVFLFTIAGAAALLTGGGVFAFFANGPGVPNTALGHQDGFRE
jgi:tetratricopeptide (TPR) repeat protein